MGHYNVVEIFVNKLKTVSIGWVAAAECYYYYYYYLPTVIRIDDLEMRLHTDNDPEVIKVLLMMVTPVMMWAAAPPVNMDEKCLMHSVTMPMELMRMMFRRHVDDIVEVSVLDLDLSRVIAIDRHHN